MCLSCHGSVKQNISAETLKVINENYPDDKAIGYGLNELRGLFVVEMEKQSESED
jgi:hypothetical protein